MKGIIFTEFLELVETGFGMEVADQVITRGCPFHNAGFTSVGSYDHRDLISMVGELSNLAGTRPSDLGARVRQAHVRTLCVALSRGV